MGIGLAAYWPQFEGLHERLLGYQREVEAAARRSSAPRSSRRGSSTPPRARARPATCSPPAGVDVVMVYAATYATSSQVLPAVQAAKAPVVILNLQPARSLDYEAHDDRRVARELLGLLRARARRRVHARAHPVPHGDGHAARRRPRLGRACAAGSRPRAAVRGVRRARFGFLGHNYPGMLDMYSDFTQIQAQVGSHVEILEIDDLVARVEGATRRRGGAQGRRDPRRVRARRPRRRPDRRRDRARALRVVGARRGGPRPARRATSRSTA